MPWMRIRIRQNDADPTESGIPITPQNATATFLVLPSVPYSVHCNRLSDLP
jgi:hypothetical protein